MLAAPSILAATALAAGGGLPAGPFARHVDNPWFPLHPGTVLTYRGVKDRRATRDVFVVTRRTREILGVRATVVRDRLYAAGHLAERTADYYAQDRRGAVWYLGEDTAELNARGRVTSREGSWLAGRHGARAGVFMPARPRPGMTGRQEYLRGHAEDHFRILARGVRVRTPGASSTNGLLTAEWTPLEPGVLDHKFYVRGVGTAVERSVRGPREVDVLESVRRGS